MRNAEDFNRYYATVDPWKIRKAAFRDHALRRATSKYSAGRSVLELGCGEGHLTQAVFGDAGSVVGVDVSDIAIARAQALGLPNASFQAADFLDVPFAGYDVIAAIECLYYLSPAEQDAVMDKVATEHRSKPFILSVPIIGGKYFTHAGVVALLSRHGMRLVEFRNVTVHWDTPVKRTVQIALRLMPLRDRLIDYVPSGLIYQRCYVAT